jgi:hypothetical protein
MHLSKVVLPLPLLPTNTSVSALSKEKEMFFNPLKRISFG